MIALDTSSLVAYFAGLGGEDTEATRLALEYKQAVLPPVVLAELFSDPKLPESIAAALKRIPMLAVTEGYWERAGRLRARVIWRGLKARLADSLIAQSCLDSDVGLITRDADFRHFARSAGLKLFPSDVH
mgnify:CR=1 FL=1